MKGFGQRVSYEVMGLLRAEKIVHFTKLMCIQESHMFFDIMHQNEIKISASYIYADIFTRMVCYPNRSTCGNVSIY